MHRGLPARAGAAVAAAVLAFGLSACSGELDTDGDGARVDVDVTTPSE